MSISSVMSLLLLSSAPTSAKSWCAEALVAHEWGVQVFDARGTPSADVPMPPWFHTTAPQLPVPVAGGPVRGMMPDTGERALPILQFYVRSPEHLREVPVAVEVGFTQGQASGWFPQVDRLTPAAVSNSLAAQQRRDEILAMREANASMEAVIERVSEEDGNPLLPADPTRQLGWDRLTLTAARPEGARLERTDIDWVRQLRASPGALWVSRPDQAERFIFYEARTTEQPAVSIERLPSGLVRLTNRSDWAVYDVFVTLQPEAGGERSAVFVPALPAGARAEVALTPTDHAALTAQLRERMVEPSPAIPSSPTGFSDSYFEDCVMQRDPAVPVERAEGHRLFEHEVDVIVDVWGERMFGQEGAVVVYRESTEALDALMPLSIYTSMWHYVRLRRLGLVLWEGVPLE